MKARNPEPIDPGVDIGHVHLKVADLDRALAFYCGVLGFELQQQIGDEAAFVSADGYHHHIGLNTWHSKGAPTATASSCTGTGRAGSGRAPWVARGSRWSPNRSTSATSSPSWALDRRTGGGEDHEVTVPVSSQGEIE